MQKWIVAHRGARLKAPENTLEAFEAAIIDGANMIELDVRRTSDAVMVIHHDALFEGREISKTDWRILREFSRNNGKSICSLQESLEFCRGRIALDIELKEAGYESEFLDLLNAYWTPSETIITSFLPIVLRRIKDLDPKWKTGLLLGASGFSFGLMGLFQYLDELFPVKKLKETGVDFVVPHLALVKAGFLIWNNKVPAMIWTVNNPRLARKLLKNPRVVGLITDDPKGLLS